MKIVHSYGVIPFQKKNSGLHVLLVQLYAGHWGFPKGVQEKGENPLETAFRELKEETGMEIESLLSKNVYEETYFFILQGEKIKKTVTYYPAIVQGKEAMQTKELAAMQWVLFEDVAGFLTFPELKKVWKEIQEREIF